MINIAIDGPAGAGKSSLARKAAAKLGYIYVDTGALYRSVALFMLQRGIDPYDTAAVITALPMVDVELRYVDGEQRVYLCGENVSAVIRTPEVSSAASVVSAIPRVREFLLDLQENIAQTNDIIMDGRDIGTVILPKAQVKVFLTATPEERATRRYRELKERGVEVEYDDVLREVVERDYNDSHRAIAPLKPAEDSIELDTTGLDLEQSLKSLLSIIEKRLAEWELQHTEEPVFDDDFGGDGGADDDF